VIFFREGVEGQSTSLGYGLDHPLQENRRMTFCAWSSKVLG